MQKLTWFIFDEMIFTLLGMALPFPYHNSSCRGLALPSPKSARSVKNILSQMNHAQKLRGTAVFHNW